MKAFFIIIALLVSLIGKSQYTPLGAITLWTEGYVITLSNDTIRGQVRIGSLTNDSPTTILIRTADNQKMKLTGEDIRLVAQKIPNFAYATGSIPHERELVIFERVPDPRRNNKPTLLERLTRSDGDVALYVDASGWKKSTDFTFGNFIIETNHNELSYVAVKNGTEAFVARRGEIETVYERLFGDCPEFWRTNPAISRKDWRYLGDVVAAYNRLCHHL